jgi:hypothetical protein
MNKSAEDLIQELKEGKLPSFWISRNDDAPWADKITIVTKKQEAEIIDLFIELLKSKKVIKVPKNKNVKGFCKKEADLSRGFYRMLQDPDKQVDFLVYAENNEYAGMSVLRPRETRNNHGFIYISLLCSIKKGSGTKIINIIKDAVKTGTESGEIELSPLQSAVGFYKKLGFIPTMMTWFYDDQGESEVQLEEPKASSGGYRKNGFITLRSRYRKNAGATSHNFTQKSRKLV